MGEGFSAAGRTHFRRWRKRPCPNGLAYLVDVVKLFHNFSLAILDLTARDCNNPCKLNRSFEFVLAHNIYFFKYLIVIMYLKMRTGSHAVGHAHPHGQRNYTFPLCHQEP